MPSIGLGVIGAGYWGPKLVRTAQATRQFQLRWLCDHHQDRARATLGDQDGVRITTCNDEVLGDPGVWVLRCGPLRWRAAGPRRKAARGSPLMREGRVG